MRIKKILFISPPAFTSKLMQDINPLPPLNFGYIASNILKQGFGVEIKILDSLLRGWATRENMGKGIIKIGLRFEDIAAFIQSYRPDIVGITAMFTCQWRNSHTIAEIVKKVSPEIKTVMGGAYPTASPDSVMKDKNIDFLILGEGEERFVNLLMVLEGRMKIQSMEGIGFREGNEYKIIPNIKLIYNLDKLPFPNYNLINLPLYFGLQASHGYRKCKRFSPILTSRGCPARCVFCSAQRIWGYSYRARSPENVIAEMQLLKDKYGVEEIMFEDDNVTFDRDRAIKMFDLMVEKKLGFALDTPNGVAAWTLDKEVINKMYEAGCRRINFALESGNQEHLNKNIKKPLDLAKIPLLVKYAKKLGLEVGIFLVIGIPGETENMIWDSFKMSALLDTFHPFISIATPYPGSELYEICEKKGFLNKDFNFDKLFIRGYIINTPEWDGKKLKNIYIKYRKWLFKVYLETHPIECIFDIIKKIYKYPKIIWYYITEYF